MDKDIFIDCNNKAVELFGCQNKNQLIGKPPYLFSPDFQEDGRSSKEKALEKINNALNGNKQTFEWLHTKLDGTIFYCEVSLSAFFMEEELRIFAIVRDISERKKIENEIINKQKMFERIIDYIPDPTFVIDNNGRVIFWNKEIENLTKVKAKDIIGKSNYEYSIPFFKVRRPILIDLALKNDKVTGKEYAYIKKENDIVLGESSIDDFHGKKIYLWGKAIPLYDNKNNIVGAIESIRDITELKENEIALTESERKCREIFDSTTDSIQIDEITQNGGKIIDCNFTTLSMYGYDSKEEILSLKIGDLSANIFPYTEEMAQEKIKQALKGEIPIFEWFAKKKDGEVFWVEVTLRKVNLAGKERVLAIVRDIDKRKIAERKLKESEENLKATLHSIADAVISIDLKGNILFFNESFTKLTGFESKVLQNTKINEILKIKNDINEKTLINPLDIILSKKLNEDFVYNKILVTKEGKYKNIDYSISAIHADKENIIGFVIVIKDITENLRLLEQIQIMKKLESLGVLAAGIAHDFNNLLEGIYGFINLALYSEDKNELDNFLSNALNSIERAKNLTNQLLTFAKGKDTKRKVHSISKILKETVQFCTSGTSVETEFNVDENLWNSEVNEGQISQVIQNLVINSIQSVSVKGKIVINAKNIDFNLLTHPILKGKYIQIEIIDNGKGIPKEILSKIFDPFFTTKERGSGLGLTICHSIITQHNGYIEVEARENIGTKFTIYLPASENQIIINEIKEEKKELKNKKILALDDDITLLKVISKMFEKLECIVTTVNNGEKAIEIFTENYKNDNRFDAIFFDLTIKDGMSGTEAIKEIREIDKKVPAFVMSGYSDDNIISNPKEYGFTDSLNKPFTLKELEDLLHKYL